MLKLRDPVSARAIAIIVNWIEELTRILRVWLGPHEDHPPRIPGSPTQLLRAWGNGDERALEQLAPLVHDELRRLHARIHGSRAARPYPAGHGARQRSFSSPDQPEANPLAGPCPLLRDVCARDAKGPGRFARARHGDKRGGGVPALSLDAAVDISDERTPDLVALDEALAALAVIHPRKSQVVELRFFGGLSFEEAAEALHVSSDTVRRDWRFAKVWLLRELRAVVRQSLLSITATAAHRIWSITICLPSGNSLPVLPVGLRLIR